MHEADDLLRAMEVEAAKLINADKLKSLFEWAERITDTTDSQYSGCAKRAFAIHQYSLLYQLNKVHETVKYKNRDSQNFYPHFYFYPNLYQDLYLDIYSGRDINLSIDLYVDLFRDRDLDLDIDLYLNQVHHFSLNLLFYHDFYRYMDAGLYSSDFSKFGNRFDRELSERIEVVKCVKEKNIFKGVNLQLIIQRFNEEQKFIKAVGKGESVEPPAESIHDTWLSVLDIIDDMLAISDEELKSYTRYLRAADLIVACKEAAGRVSPKVWQKIEEKLLT